MIVPFLREGALAAPCSMFRSREASDFVEYYLNGTGAAAAFRCAAERGVHLAYPRTGCGARNRGYYLTVAEDVATANDHGALLAVQAE
jgi:hypothetical protein